MASWLGSCPMTGMRALQALATPTPLHAISQRPHFTPARSSNRLQRHCSAFAAAVIAPQHGLCTAWRPVRVASARAAAPPAAVQQSAITRQRRPVWAAATAAEAEPPQQQQQPPQPMSAAGDVQDLKQQLRDAIAGTDRGIFGLPSAKRAAIAQLVEALESANPIPAPTAALEMVAGPWTLLYTTITITGVKKTKLGLREFIKLGAFEQHIDRENALALNVVHFNVAGLGMFSGSLTVRAAYEVVSDSRVSIRFLESTMVPEQLQSLFQANYALLLSIFNPEGWLDITYVDDDMRVGRDDKGNLFVLQRGASTGANKA